MHEDEPEILESGCGCFRSFWCTGQRRVVIGNSDDRSYLLTERGEHRELWVVKQLKKLKEVSELIAGPKWKNFLRKIGAYCNNRVKRRKDFRYDSYDYALNFDVGIDEDDNEYGAGLGFSSRFAPPVVPDHARSYTT